jgi:choline dehydrogenase
MNSKYERQSAADFVERVRMNQRKLKSDLKAQYDFIVCGSGSSGSAVARRLAENPDVSVLLLEAGGDDDVPEVMEAGKWPMNLGSERDWSFHTQPNPALNGRSVLLSMGKVLGGGSSINGMYWVRGHKNDWDFFAAEAGDPAWNYDSVLNIYRRIEDWDGEPDPGYRGAGGLLFVRPTQAKPVCTAMFESARALRIPTFDGSAIQVMLCRDIPQKSSGDSACCRSTFARQHYLDTTTVRPGRTALCSPFSRLIL